MMLNKTVIGAAMAAAFMSAAAGPRAVGERLRGDARRDQAPARRSRRAEEGGARCRRAGRDSTGWGDRIEALEVKSGDAVVKGDIGGSFRLPGSETSLRIYGFAEGHAIHDLKAAGPSDTFTDLMFQPLDGSGGQKGKTKFTAQTSRFGFESSTPTELGAFNTKVEMDFYSYGSGNRNRLRLRHAYGEYAGFLVGQTWSTFMDLDDLPETVDFNGPIGAPFSRRTMVRYTYADAKAGYKLTAALRRPGRPVRRRQRERAHAADRAARRQELRLGRGQRTRARPRKALVRRHQARLRLRHRRQLQDHRQGPADGPVHAGRRRHRPALRLERLRDRRDHRRDQLRQEPGPGRGLRQDLQRPAAGHAVSTA